jgi:anhydro-N-acetylmuramic acid kinase
MSAHVSDRPLRVIGLMSGTSADGIDVALCAISGAPPQVQVRIEAAQMFPFPADFQARVLAAAQPATSDVQALCRINAELGGYFAQAVLNFLYERGISPDTVDLIGSHGQTLWHQVEADGCVSATLQVGEAAIIAERTNITTISNFRPRDVAAGGQGAPLTAYVDWLLLRHPTQWRAVQNIGGISNVTFLPPLNDTQSAPLAFDNGPGNALMDSAVHHLTGTQHYDVDGQLAAQGQVHAAWLARLLAHPYFERQPPKTTGRELFSREMALTLIHEGESMGLKAADILATLTAFTAQSIAESYQRFAPAPVQDVILGGGGRRNPVLMAHLERLLRPAKVLTHEAVGLDSDNKEALVFALLAYETWHQRVGTHPALTGAAHASVLGQITPAGNYAALARRTWGT